LEDEKETEAITAVELEDYTVTTVSDYVKEHCFTINHVTNFSYYLSSESEIDQESWMAIIIETVKEIAKLNKPAYEDVNSTKNLKDDIDDKKKKMGRSSTLSDVKKNNINQEKKEQPALSKSTSVRALDRKKTDNLTKSQYAEGKTSIRRKDDEEQDEIKTEVKSSTIKKKRSKRSS